MDQDLEMLQSRMTLLVAKCVDTLHNRIVDLQGQMAALKAEHQLLQQQVMQQQADVADAEPAPQAQSGSRMSPEQRRQIQQSLNMLAKLSGWGRPAQETLPRFVRPALPSPVISERRSECPY